MTADESQFAVSEIQFLCIVHQIVVLKQYQRPHRDCLIHLHDGIVQVVEQHFIALLHYGIDVLIVKRLKDAVTHYQMSADGAHGIYVLVVQCPEHALEVIVFYHSAGEAMSCCHTPYAVVQNLASHRTDAHSAVCGIVIGTIAHVFVADIDVDGSGAYRIRVFERLLAFWSLQHSCQQVYFARLQHLQ